MIPAISGSPLSEPCPAIKRHMTYLAKPLLPHILGYIGDFQLSSVCKSFLSAISTTKKIAWEAFESRLRQIPLVEYYLDELALELTPKEKFWGLYRAITRELGPGIINELDAPNRVQDLTLYDELVQKMNDLSLERVWPTICKEFEGEVLPPYEATASTIRAWFNHPENEPLFRRGFINSCLCITKTKLWVIPQEIKKFTEISKLDFLDCNLHVLTPDQFTPFSRLKVLFLCTNKIKKVAPTQFEGLVNLIQIRIDRNKIKVLPETLFQGLDKLQELSLSYNLIEEVPIEAFRGCVDIGALDLVQNKLRKFPCEIVRDPQPEMGMSLEENMIPREDFAQLSSYRPELLFFGEDEQLPPS